MDAEQAYLFRHALLRQAAYELHLPSARAALHRLALAILAEVPGLDRNAAALELADHARLGNEESLPEHERAALRQAEVEHSLAGARFAAAQFNAALAVAAYERALAVMASDDPRRAESEGALADQLSRQGRLQDALAAFERSAAAAPDTEVAGRAQVHRAWLARALGRREHALRDAEIAEATAERLGSEKLRVACLILRSIFDFDAGRLEAGLELQREAARRAQAAGDFSQSLSAQANIAAALLQQGKADQALPHTEHAEAMAAKANNLDMQVIVMAQRGLIACQRRAYGHAREIFERACALARKSGARLRLVESLADLATAQLGVGDLEACAHTAATMAEIAQDTGSPQHARVAQIKAALVERAGLRLGRALELWRALEADAADEFSRAEAGIEVALCLALAQDPGAAQKVAELESLPASRSDYLVGGLWAAKGLCAAGQLAATALTQAIGKLGPPADDCMHDTIQCYARLATLGNDARKWARDGLAEARRRGLDIAASPLVRSALVTLHAAAQ